MNNKASSDLSFAALMATTQVESLSDQALLALIGDLIDAAADQTDASAVEDGTKLALQWCEVMDKRDISDVGRVSLYYFQANAWANRKPNKEASWSWEQPAVTQQIFYLRRALNGEGFQKTHSIRRCQILTNLANQLNFLGRFVEAGEYWNRALAIDPNFWMALGNRGYGRKHYAFSLYDPGHQGLMIWTAYRDLKAAQSIAIKHPHLGHEEAATQFEQLAKEIEKRTKTDFLNQEIDLGTHSMGRSKQEKEYRTWCLLENLFLNPLNDLGPHPISAHDVLHLPGITTDADQAGPPPIFGFYNQMKQEYVSARWLYFEAVNAEKMHFSDKGVLLFNTLDYPAYGLSIEKLKASFRICYSVFDKIAYLINDYMKLGMREHEVSYKSIWTKNHRDRKSPLRTEFGGLENLPFRGLYWLSIDFFEPDFGELMEPDAKELSTIRNHVEHKYFKLHDRMFGMYELERLNDFADTLSHSVQLIDFEAKTLRLLKLARAGLIYLSLGIHVEERQRGRRSPDNVVLSMHLDRWEDTWKR